MNSDDTTNTMQNSGKDDWADFDAMTGGERLAAALSDPDAQPMTAEQLARKPIARAKIIRRVLNLSQKDFAARLPIPLGTLRDWERGRKEPDAAARAYLTVIGRNPGNLSASMTNNVCKKAWSGRLSRAWPFIRELERDGGDTRRLGGFGARCQAILPSRRADGSDQRLGARFRPGEYRHSAGGSRG